MTGRALPVCLARAWPGVHAEESCVELMHVVV